MKTMYKDTLFIPSRFLALALAEEWDRQLSTIDMRTMQLNTMFAKAVRSRVDDGSLEIYKKKEIAKVLNND
jgi:chaperone required for assembly of F1-ATPase